MEKLEQKLFLIKQTLSKINNIFYDELLLLLSWFDLLLKYKFIYRENRTQIKRRDIYDINLGINIGSELNKKRPCVIISTNGFNQGNTVVVIPLKSIKNTSKDGIVSLFLNSEGTNLDKDSYVSIANIREVSKRRIGRKIGKISKDDMIKIENSLSVFLGIKKRPSQGEPFLKGSLYK